MNQAFLVRRGKYSFDKNNSKWGKSIAYKLNFNIEKNINTLTVDYPEGWGEMLSCFGAFTKLSYESSPQKLVFSLDEEQQVTALLNQDEVIADLKTLLQRNNADVALRSDLEFLIDNQERLLAFLSADATIILSKQNQVTASETAYELHRAIALTPDMEQKVEELKNSFPNDTPKAEDLFNVSLKYECLKKDKASGRIQEFKRMNIVRSEEVSEEKLTLISAI